MFVEEKAKGEVKELDEISQVLLAGAAYIEAHGHATNISGRDGDKRCMLCSLWESRAPYEIAWQAELWLRHELDGCITSFNDHHSATEVVAKMRALAFSR